MPNTLTIDELVATGIPAGEAGTLAAALASGAALPPPERWQRLVAGPLHPRLPFAAHLLVYNHVFTAWDERRGPRPAWTPAPEEAAATNAAALMRAQGFTRYDELYAWSIRERP